MHKKRGDISLQLRIVSIVLFLIMINIAVFSVKYRDEIISPDHSIMQGITKSYNEANIVLKIVVLLEVILIFGGATSVIIRTKKIKNRKDEIEKIRGEIFYIKKSKITTDLDVLYQLLKENKSMELYSIISVFNIDKETALEWCNILENSNFAKIDYNLFGGIVLKLVENEKT